MRLYIERTWGWDEAWQSQYFQEHFDPSKLEIVEANGVAIGYLSVEQREDLIFLRQIEIAPAYQSRGIGTKLIQPLLDEAEG
jgi:N-acetylglutamate synthase-like GNAT family acetyltransferase